jgi:enoyl-CoA hydratase/carnithine racemase
MAKVSYERRGAAAIVTITRPERRNAVDAETAELLLGAYHRFEADQEAIAMVLTGEGEQAFCAGADLKALAEIGPQTGAERIDEIVSRPEGPMGFTRITPAKPAIAAISGWCLAGGLELALWCDLRIAASGARLGFTERRFGVPLIDGGTQRLPRVVGLGRALELILTGRVVDAEEALRWGLVNEVVEAGRHVDRALEIAEGLAGFPRATMLSDRRAALDGIGLPFAEGMRLEAELGHSSVATGIEGAARFVAGEGRGAEGAGV